MGWKYNMATPDTIGLRFKNVTIPKNDTINYAKLRIWVFTNGEIYGASCTIYGVDTDNEPAFSSSNRPKDQTCTTANISFAPSQSFTSEYVLCEIDVKSIVEEITTGAGWASGNAMCFIFKSGSTYAGPGMKMATFEDTGCTPNLTISSITPKVAPGTIDELKLNIGDVWKTSASVQINIATNKSEFNY